MKTVYAISYCQNEYQRERVRKFVQAQGAQIVNHEFGLRWCDVLGYRKGGCLGMVVHDNESDLVRHADEAWFILGAPAVHFSIFPFNTLYLMYGFNKFLRNSGLKRRYFKIAQTGGYAGRAREVTKKELERIDRG